MERPSKGRRKRLAQEWKEQERAAREAALPFSRESLMELRAYLSREFDLGQPCDHSFCLTREWLDARLVLADSALVALRDLGVSCDCEVLANVHPQDIFPRERAPRYPVTSPQPKAPAPATYEDDAVAISPPRPWRVVETRPGVLLALRLGKGGSGPRLSLLALDEKAHGDLGGWCRRRWSDLHRDKWQRIRGDSGPQARERADAEWERYGFRVSLPGPTGAGLPGGSMVIVSTPTRTDVYQWWVLHLPRGTRVLELETEANRLANDQRAVEELIRAFSTKG